MPRLLQRPRPRPSGPSQASGSRAEREGNTELPPYQPLLQPLDEASQRKLRELTNSRNTRRLASHIDKSIRYLQCGVGYVNDRGTDRRAESQKRREGGKLPARDQDALELKAGKAEQAALLYTKQTEAAIRRVIDVRVELEDEDKVFTSVFRQLEAQPRPRPQGQAERSGRRGTRREVDSDGEEMDVDEDEAGQEPESEIPVVTLRQMLETARQEQAGAYARLSMHERYGMNNDYIQFKRTCHDARHQDDEVQLPDASRWFDQNGEPVIDDARPTQDQDQDEDDLVVERVVRDFKCPLSLQWMTEPYSNNVCSHTFDKINILSYLRGSGGSAKCPVAGCNHELCAKDFFFDEVFLRKSKRAQEAEMEADDSEAEVDPDVSMAVTKEVAINLKKERPTPRRHHRAAEEEEDDDEGV